MRLTVPYADMLAAHCRAVGLPAPHVEFLFAPPRRWRFDLAWPDQMLACEVEGVIYPTARGAQGLGGRHVSVSGFAADIEKYAEAICRGWLVLRVLPTHVTSGVALGWIERALAYVLPETGRHQTRTPCSGRKPRE